MSDFGSSGSKSFPGPEKMSSQPPQTQPWDFKIPTRELPSLPPEIIKQNVREYREQVKKYEGFYIESSRPLQFKFKLTGGGIMSFDPNHEISKTLAEFAVNEYNDNENKGPPLGITRIVRVNVELGSPMTYFITLQASDSGFYEAKVWTKVGENSLSQLNPNGSPKGSL
ncbi:Cystatin domain containing protein [Trema orientale]|uniref:Cysteine proteinase inhibitor n=1 Tax=Trema orientale TaxID=63057 RepID=A0A2P5DGH0_TREOI|nr:Cystatin domain containing protein [Trema orientale]